MPSAREERAYNELTAWTLSRRDGEFIHQHVVDAWAAQHADQTTRPIAIAFSLIGLYLHLEKGFTGRQVQRAHMQLTQPAGRGPGRKDWPLFPLPKDRGRMTACDVWAAPEPERAKAIDQWCRSVWEAWRESHAAIVEFAGELASAKT